MLLSVFALLKISWYYHYSPSIYMYVYVYVYTYTGLSKYLDQFEYLRCRNLGSNIIVHVPDMMGVILSIAVSRKWWLSCFKYNRLYIPQDFFKTIQLTTKKKNISFDYDWFRWYNINNFYQDRYPTSPTSSKTFGKKVLKAA